MKVQHGNWFVGSHEFVHPDDREWLDMEDVSEVRRHRLVFVRVAGLGWISLTPAEFARLEGGASLPLVGGAS